jgi:hypothetical protein
MTRDEIAAIVTALGDLVQIVRDADPADKSKIYTQLGLTLTYQLRRRVVEATIKSGQNMHKGSVSEGGLEHGNRCDFPGSGKSCNKSNTTGADAPGYSAACSLSGPRPWLGCAAGAGICSASLGAAPAGTRQPHCAGWPGYHP